MDDELLNVEELEEHEKKDPHIRKYLKKIEKQRSRVRLKEVRKVLLGNLLLTEDNRLTPGGDFRMPIWGSPDGAFGTLLFGIREKKIPYEMKSGNNEQALYKAAEGMMNIGRTVLMDTVSNGTACLIRHMFFRPVVLIFEKRDEGLFLCAYCGRDIFTWSSIRRAVKLFDAHKPKGLEAVEKSKDDNEDGGDDSADGSVIQKIKAKFKR